MKKNIIILIILFLTTSIFSASFSSLEKKGRQFYQEKDYKKAIEYWKKAKIKNPDDAKISFNLGHAYYRNEDYDLAAKSYNEVLNKKDTFFHSLAYYNKANALFKAGEKKQLQSKQGFQESLKYYQNAVDQYQKSYALDTHYQPTLDNLKLAKKRVELIKKYQQNQQNQDNKNQEPSLKAKEAFEKFLVLINQNKYQEAKEILGLIILTDPTAQSYQPYYKRTENIINIKYN